MNPPGNTDFSLFSAQSFRDWAMSHGFIPHFRIIQMDDSMSSIEPEDRKSARLKAEQDGIPFVPTLQLDVSDLAADQIQIKDNYFHMSVSFHGKRHNIKFKGRDVIEYLAFDQDTGECLLSMSASKSQSVDLFVDNYYEEKHGIDASSAKPSFPVLEKSKPAVRKKAMLKLVK